MNTLMLMCFLFCVVAEGNIIRDFRVSGRKSSRRDTPRTLRAKLGLQMLRPESFSRLDRLAAIRMMLEEKRKLLDARRRGDASMKNVLEKKQRLRQEVLLKQRGSRFKTDITAKLNEELASKSIKTAIDSPSESTLPITNDDRMTSQDHFTTSPGAVTAMSPINGSSSGNKASSDVNTELSDNDTTASSENVTKTSSDVKTTSFGNMTTSIKNVTTMSSDNMTTSYHMTTMSSDNGATTSSDVTTAPSDMTTTSPDMNTTSLDNMTAMASDNIVTSSSGVTRALSDNVTTTPPENVTMPSDNGITTSPENMTMPSDNGTTTPSDNETTTSFDNVSTTPPENVTTTSDNVSTTQSENVTTTSGNGTTTSFDNVTTTSFDIATTAPSNVTTMQSDSVTTSSDNVTTTSFENVTTLVEKVPSSDNVTTQPSEDATTIATGTMMKESDDELMAGNRPKTAATPSLDPWDDPDFDTLGLNFVPLGVAVFEEVTFTSDPADVVQGTTTGSPLSTFRAPPGTGETRQQGPDFTESRIVSQFLSDIQHWFASRRHSSSSTDSET